jgi:hypothetical protein
VDQALVQAHAGVAASCGGIYDGRQSDDENMKKRNIADTVFNR